MKEQIAVGDEALVRAVADFPDHGVRELTRDAAFRRLGIVNVVFLGPRHAPDRGWTLVDTGLPGTSGLIERAARDRFGAQSRPAAIILTHGHFDHVGGLRKLAEHWNAPILAHPREFPYLDGRAAYPPPDPTVGGGLMAALSVFYPRGPVNVRPWLQALPADGTVPGLTGWRWIPTPGHTPGHISLWRERDRLLVAGDAFITTIQESAYAVAVQKPAMHEPPMDFTPDWAAARDSVRTLAALAPETVITGHGPPMHGAEMLSALELLADEFERIAVPTRTPYLDHPARAEDGTAYVPPKE